LIVDAIACYRRRDIPATTHCGRVYVSIKIAGRVEFGQIAQIAIAVAVVAMLKIAHATTAAVLVLVQIVVVIFIVFGERSKLRLLSARAF
jgi:hypothetical protein